MKPLAYILFAFLIISCNTEKNQENTVRDLAKKDILEKLQLSEGTKFNDENIEVKEESFKGEGIETEYVVKITVKSQDKEGNEVVKTHTMHYKKIKDGGLAPEDYELTSFE